MCIGWWRKLGLAILVLGGCTISLHLTTMEDDRMTNSFSPKGIKNAIDMGRHLSKLSPTERYMAEHFNITNMTQSRWMVTVDMSRGRLGNDIFRYAALRGIAARNQRMPVLINTPEKLEKLSEIFILRPELFTKDESVLNRDYQYKNEQLPCTYDTTMERLPEADMVVANYFQSWRYFDGLNDDIKEELSFREPLKRKVQDFFWANVTGNHHGDNVYVAVHVRNRYDTVFADDESGRQSTPVAYYLRAMDYFRKRFSNVVFIMTCCNVHFCKTELTTNLKDVVLSEGASPEFDFALLSSCSHTIMSPGTFSWWAAWLNNGITLYPPGYPAKGAKLERRFNATDYYLPQWIRFVDY